MFIVYALSEENEAQLKELFQKEGVNFMQYPTIGAAHIDDVIMRSIETCMEYEDVDRTIENMNKMEQYFNENAPEPKVRTIVNKMSKAEADINHIIYEIFDGKKEDILKTELPKTEA